MSVPSPRTGVEDHHSDTAEEFLATLGVRHSLWADAPTAWIFRGQRDAEWPLKAKAVRELKSFAAHGVSPDPAYVPGPAWADRVHLQNRLLEIFRLGLDRAGFVIPSPSVAIKRHHDDGMSSSAEPDAAAFPLMALAQHHGLPTMFLDWTRRAWVGAYFAAVGAADPETRGSATHLAVWALERRELRRPSFQLVFYDAPGGTNPNVSAQSGTFTMLVTDDAIDPSLEEYLARADWRPDAGVVTPPKLVRVTLALSEAPKLLRLLSYEGITGASLFPGADGVVRAMRETTLWDRRS